MPFGLSFVHWLVVLSALITIVGAARYIRNTLRGQTKPNLVTWSMWALAPLVGTGAALSAHADPWTIVRIFLAGFLPVLVIVAVIIKPQGYWKLTPFDILCGVCSLVALVAWLFAGKPVLAVVLAAAGDGFAAIPTIIKSWKHPETETGFTFIMSLVSILLVIPSIPNLRVENWAFQIYLVVCNSLLVIAVYRKRGKAKFV